MEQDAGAALETAYLITDAVTMLENHPLLGRAMRDELRELVISRGQSGYLALYDYHAGEGEILILSIRHQREAGYTDPSVLD